MSNEQENIIQAPTYNDLFLQLMQLREQVERMKGLEQISAPTPTPVADFRMFPYLNHSVSTFNGRESKVWLNTIKDFDFTKLCLSTFQSTFPLCPVSSYLYQWFVSMTVVQIVQNVHLDGLIVAANLTYH